MWADFNAEEVPNEVILYMLDLIDRINYTYLKTDGTYGNLPYVVFAGRQVNIDGRWVPYEKWRVFE